MRVVRFAAVLLVVPMLAGSCVRTKRAPEHREGGAETAVVMPTPDTTPVEALRTPAGLVLKTEPEPTVTPVPAGGAVR
jgi:hypothetical protein